MNKKIDTLLKIGIAIILIIAATMKMEYSFYTLVRWSVMATSIYFAYKSYERKQIGLVIYFSIIAILFNTLKPIWFQKDTWRIIDWIVAIGNLMTIYFDWKLQTTKKTGK